MNTYDLIAFDMDGTLLNSGKKLTSRTLDAIARAAAAGKTVALSTGRAFCELQEYTAALKDVHYYICESGGYLYDAFAKKTIASSPIPPHLVEQLIQTAAPEDLMIYMVGNGISRCTRSDVMRMEYFQIEVYKQLMLDTAILYDDMIEAYHRDPFPVEKLNYYCVSPALRDRMRETLSTLPLVLAYSEVTSLEISPQNVSKGTGLKKLCEYLSLPLEKTIAVGDSYNDMEILKLAGLSVAMGNAHAPVKELSDVTVADNDHDGCAEAIDRYLLNRK